MAVAVGLVKTRPTLQDYSAMLCNEGPFMNTSTLRTLHWEGALDGHLVLIDQTLLPTEFKEIACRDVETVWEAIKVLRVRGAPAIGVAAAYGVCVGLQTAAGADDAVFFQRFNDVLTYL